MIVPLLSFSQNGYPKVILINGDTLIAITKDQQRRINLVKVERDYYKEYADSLNVATDLLDIALVDCKELTDHFNKEIGNIKKLSTEQKRFIRQLRADFKDQGIKMERIKRFNTILGGYSIAVTVVLIILLL